MTSEREYRGESAAETVGARDLNHWTGGGANGMVKCYAKHGCVKASGQ